MTDVLNLIAAFREDMFDPEVPGATDDSANPSSESLWTDAEIKRFISYAQNDFCRASNCLADATLFKPAVTADDPLVKADERIIKPRTAYLESTATELYITTEREMDEAAITYDYGLQVPRNWRGEGKTGTPRILITDDQTGYYTLYPTPVVDDVLHIAAYRLPKSPVYDGGELEIPEEYRLRLLVGMKVHAFNKDDVEVNDPANAKKYGEQWDRYLELVSGHFKQKRKGPHRVQMGGGYW